MKQATKFFFDRKVVTDAVDRARLRVLARGGALVRTIARRSMRRRKKSSPAGSPPSAHAGQLRDLLFFFYDKVTSSTVVGPTRIGNASVPPLLEFGGQVTTDREVFVPGAVQRNQAGQFAASKGGRVPAGTTLTYAGNPYMGPALTKAAPSLPPMWANSVKGG